MVQTTILELSTPQATFDFGYQIAQSLTPLRVILLQGDLGAGKTTLVQGIGKGLGIKEEILSPTFTLINEYPEGGIPLYHLDLYRLTPEEVTAIHPEIYWEGIEVPPGITVIEWPERLPYYPSEYLLIDITIIATGRRLKLELFHETSIDPFFKLP